MTTTENNPTLVNKSKYDDATMADQLRVWAKSLSSLGGHGSLLPGVIAGMQQVANDLDPRERRGFRVTLELERAWSDDAQYVMRRCGFAGDADHLPGIFRHWREQVADEFYEAAGMRDVFNFTCKVTPAAMVVTEATAVDGQGTDFVATFCVTARGNALLRSKTDNDVGAELIDLFGDTADETGVAGIANSRVIEVGR